MEVSFRLNFDRFLAVIFLDVSILVLMEVSFRRMPYSASEGHMSRFNPCFNGSIFQTPLVTYRYTLNNSVSILVLMEVSFRQKPVYTPSPGTLTFQSLF